VYSLFNSYTQPII